MTTNPALLSPANHVLAIDLGTGTCALAVIKDGRPFTLKGPEGTTIPTVVFRQDDGSAVVGQAALRMAYRDVTNVYSNFKVAMKTDGVAALSADGSFTVVDAFAAVFKHLLGVALQTMPYLGSFPQFGGDKYQAEELRVAITIPAVDFGMQQVAKYRSALGQSGFPQEFLDDVVFFKEPYAAAHAALAERSLRGALMEGDVVAVVDLGDGTLDITITEFREGLLHTKSAHSGIADLGGSNLTAALADVIGKQLGLEFQAFTRGKGVAFDVQGLAAEDRETQYGLWAAAADLKHQLSLADTAFATIVTTEGNREVTLSIEEAQSAWNPLFSEIAEAIVVALGKSGLKWSDVKFVAAAGGGVRTRGMCQLIADSTDRTVQDLLVCDEPQLAIVHGAVRMAQSLADVDTAAVDAMGMSYPDATGKQVVNEVYIENGQKIPASGLDVEKLTTKVRSDGQPQALKLYPFISKPSVLGNSGDLLAESEIVRLAPVDVELDLPPGEYPVAVRMRFDVAQRAMCVLSFPTLPAIESSVVNLQIEEGGAEPTFGSCSRSFVILFDTSRSVEGEPLSESKHATSRFVDAHARQGVETAIIEFGGAPKVALDFTDDVERLSQAINSFSAGGGTPMAKALDLARDICRPDTVVVLFTDGYPASKSSAREAAKRVREITELYTIAIGAGADAKLLRSMASSDSHFIPIGRANDLSIAFDVINTLIYTGESDQAIVVGAPSDSQGSAQSAAV